MNIWYDLVVRELIDHANPTQELLDEAEAAHPWLPADEDLGEDDDLAADAEEDAAA